MKQKPDTKELKRTARELLMGRHAFLAGITLTMTAINLFLDYLLLQISPGTVNLFGLILSFAGSVLLNIVYYLLLAGLYRIYLNLCRGLPVQASDLLYRFTHRPEPVAVYSVLQYVLSYVFYEFCAWYLSRCLRVLFYHSSENLLTAGVLLLLACILYLWLQLSLSMVLFLSCDLPYETARGLVRESFYTMKGVKGRYLKLELSFLGLYLLGVLSFGIGFLFTEPYKCAAKALFYEELLPASEAEI